MLESDVVVLKMEERLIDEAAAGFQVEGCAEP
jgi:hypothetical protein